MIPKAIMPKNPITIIFFISPNYFKSTIFYF